MNGTDLHDHLSRLAADVTPGRPSMPALQATADRRRLRHQRLAAGAAVVVLAGTGIGVARLASGGGHVVRTAASRSADGLPGLVARGSVTLPAGLVAQQVEREGDVVWAVGFRRSDQQQVVLHGRVGSELTPLDLRSIDLAGSDVTIALTPTRAYVALTSGASTVGRQRVPVLAELDPASGLTEDDYSLDVAQDPSHRSYDGDGAALVRTDDGAPVLAITSHSGGRQMLRLAVLDPTSSPRRDLLSTEVTPPVVVPGGDLVVSPNTPSFQGLTLVTTAHGLPTYAYLTGTYDTVPVLDLKTGAVGTYRTGSRLPESGGGLDAAAIGAVDGKIVFQVEGDDHITYAQLAAPGALTPSATAPRWPASDGGGVEVAAARVYRDHDTGTGEDSQRLTVPSLRPSGETTFRGVGDASTHGTYEVEYGADDLSLRFYAAP